MYERFKDRAAIFVVYIAEVHPLGGWELAENEQEGIQMNQHTSFEERYGAAAACAENLKMTIPTLVDNMENEAFEKFAAWPERIHIADRDGKMCYLGGQGPYDFKPKEAEEALLRLLE